MPDSYAAVSSSLKKIISHDFPTAQSLITNDETIFQKFERWSSNKREYSSFERKKPSLDYKMDNWLSV